MMSTPVAPFSYLSTLWVQVTGTWCNLQCVHCINASGPKNPWLRRLDTETVRRAIREAETFGVKEIYFTGGEPFLHEDILELLAFALQVAPTTILTNPILAGLPEARLSEESLQDSFKPCRLYHPACVTCYQTGMTCKNF